MTQSTPATEQKTTIVSTAAARLRALGPLPDGTIDLAAAALDLASLDRPGVKLDRYQQQLQEIADRVQAAMKGQPTSLHGRMNAINKVLYQELGFFGDQENYDDLQNANLMRVIDRKRGMPVTLGILYIHAARRQGWHAVGLSFPYHFVLRMDMDGHRVIVDPFDQGREMDAAELRMMLREHSDGKLELRSAFYNEIGNRDILIRLQNNLKTRFIQQNKHENALKVVSRMLLFAPDHAGLWREAGILNMRCNRAKAAIAALKQYIQREKSDDGRHEAARWIQELKLKLN